MNDRSHHRFHRLASLAVAVTIGGAVAVSTAPPAEARRSVPDATIRAAHFSPTTPGVDVYLNRFAGGKPATKLWLSAVRYGAVSTYQALSPGLYTVAMRRAGASPQSRPMLTWTLQARSGATYTVAGVGAGTAVRGVVLRDDLSRPPTGEGRVRVVQAASRAPVAAVRATSGTVIAPAARFATVTGYATMPAGRWKVRAVARSTPGIEASAPVTVRSGQVTSILLLDSKQTGITVRTVLDAASSGVVPRDAVPAGEGGTAPGPRPSAGSDREFLIAAMAGGLAAVLCALVLLRTPGPQPGRSPRRRVPDA